MRYLYAIIFMVSICASVSAQVDTLQLVEIGSIQAPSAITELYVEDLDSDSLKEIIICTSNYIYIYDSQTYEVEWTSPPLNAPTDLLFEDINGDGLIDLSVQDSANICLFDPHTPQIIWTSPDLDSTYRCYTLGDRNDDGFTDLIIVDKEPFYRFENEDNRDTVWIDIYNGPLFNLSSTVVLTFSNYIIHYGGPRFTKRIETPSNVFVYSLGDTLNPHASILLFNDINYSNEGGANPNSYYCYGSITEINGINQNIRYNNEIGRLAKGKLIAYNNDMEFNSITYFKNDYGYAIWDLTIDMYILGCDSIINEHELLSIGSAVGPLSIKWLLYDEINADNYGSEVVLAFSDWDYGVDRIYQFEEVAGDTVWQVEYQDLGTDAFAINLPALFSESKIMLQIDNQLNNYDIISGESGSQNAIVIDVYGIIERVTDFDNDENDEIFTIIDNMLYIYVFEYATGTGDDSKLPHRVFLGSNYPNPFNSSTTIEFDLPWTMYVRIDIYDILGRRVETPVDEVREAGSHRVVWDASEYSSGLYFYRLEAGEYIEIKPMIYLK